MKNFDISSLMTFEPPGWLCNNCLYIFGANTKSFFDSDRELREETWLECPVCKRQYFDTQGLIDIEPKDAMTHILKLAKIGSEMQNSVKDRKTPPMHVLLEALLAAESFVHISTYGIHETLLGSLKILSHKIDIRGIVSNADGKIATEIKQYKDEHPRMELIPVPKTTRSENTPHAKLIVIDGLLAFKGSVNFTLAGWRKLATTRNEELDVITDIGRIQELNNTFISENWLQHNSSSRNYKKEIPF